VDHCRSLLRTQSAHTDLPTPDLLIQPPIQYPIQSRWYMPLLLEHCMFSVCPSCCPLCRLCCCYSTLRSELLLITSIDRGLVLPSVSNTFSPDSWIQASLSDPCMFHAILFAASSYLDVIRNESNNPVTHYHHRSTIRTLHNSISAGGPLPATSIAAAMHLWHYEVSKCLRMLFTIFLRYNDWLIV
jgi:hypothetical protein